MNEKDEFDKTWEAEADENREKNDVFQPDLKPESVGESARKSGLAYAAAFTLFASVAFLLGVGWFLDAYFKTSPWFLVGGIVLGSIIGLYQFVKITSQINE